MSCAMSIIEQWSITVTFGLGNAVGGLESNGKFIKWMLQENISKKIYRKLL